MIIFPRKPVCLFVGPSASSASGSPGKSCRVGIRGQHRFSANFVVVRQFSDSPLSARCLFLFVKGNVYLRCTSGMATCAEARVKDVLQNGADEFENGNEVL